MYHPDEDMIFRYVSGLASDEEQLQVDAHVVDCSDCLQRIQALLYVRENFDSIWESWTAAEHGCVCRQWRLARALREAAEASPSLSERLSQWLAQLEEGLEIGVNVLVNRARKVASVAAASLPIGYEFELQPVYAGVGSVEEQTQLADHLKKGSSLLSQDKSDEAMQELLKAVKIDARSPQAAVSEVCHEGRRVLQMVADGRRGRVYVKFWSEHEEESPALAILLPRAPQAKASVAQFKPVEGEPYMLAEFENLPDDTYSLQIGPSIGQQ